MGQSPSMPKKASKRSNAGTIRGKSDGCMSPPWIMDSALWLLDQADAEHQAPDRRRQAKVVQCTYVDPQQHLLYVSDQQATIAVFVPPEIQAESMKGAPSQNLDGYAHCYIKLEKWHFSTTGLCFGLNYLRPQPNQVALGNANANATVPPSKGLCIQAEKLSLIGGRGTATEGEPVDLNSMPRVQRAVSKISTIGSGSLKAVLREKQGLSAMKDTTGALCDVMVPVVSVTDKGNSGQLPAPGSSQHLPLVMDWDDVQSSQSQSSQAPPSDNSLLPAMDAMDLNYGNQTQDDSESQDQRFLSQAPGSELQLDLSLSLTPPVSQGLPLEPITANDLLAQQPDLTPQQPTPASALAAQVPGSDEDEHADCTGPQTQPPSDTQFQSQQMLEQAEATQAQTQVDGVADSSQQADGVREQTQGEHMEEADEGETQDGRAEATQLQAEMEESPPLALDPKEAELGDDEREEGGEEETEETQASMQATMELEEEAKRGKQARGKDWQPEPFTQAQPPPQAEAKLPRRRRVKGGVKEAKNGFPASSSSQSQCQSQSQSQGEAPPKVREYGNAGSRASDAAVPDSQAQDTSQSQPQLGQPTPVGSSSNIPAAPGGAVGDKGSSDEDEHDDKGQEGAEEEEAEAEAEEGESSDEEEDKVPLAASKFCGKVKDKGGWVAKPSRSRKRRRSDEGGANAAAPEAGPRRHSEGGRGGMTETEWANLKMVHALNRAYKEQKAGKGGSKKRAGTRGKPPAKAARRARKVYPSSSSSESEDEGKAKARARRAPAVKRGRAPCKPVTRMGKRSDSTSSSESEDQDDEDEVFQPRRSRAKRGRAAGGRGRRAGGEDVAVEKGTRGKRPAKAARKVRKALSSSSSESEDESEDEGKATTRARRAPAVAAWKADAKGSCDDSGSEADTVEMDEMIDVEDDSGETPGELEEESSEESVHKRTLKRATKGEKRSVKAVDVKEPPERDRRGLEKDGGDRKGRVTKRKHAATRATSGAVASAADRAKATGRNRRAQLRVAKPEIPQEKIPKNLRDRLKSPQRDSQGRKRARRQVPAPGVKDEATGKVATVNAYYEVVTSDDQSEGERVTCKVEKGKAKRSTESATKEGKRGTKRPVKVKGLEEKRIQEKVYHPSKKLVRGSAVLVRRGREQFVLAQDDESSEAAGSSSSLYPSKVQANRQAAKPAAQKRKGRRGVGPSNDSRTPAGRTAKVEQAPGSAASMEATNSSDDELTDPDELLPQSALIQQLPTRKEYKTTGPRKERKTITEWMNEKKFKANNRSRAKKLAL
ncbi:unnamed protein product [Chrysoparadoxa australica]